MAITTAPSDDHTWLGPVACSCGLVLAGWVPFARPGARFTRHFEQLVAWLATKMDKDAIRRLVSVDWATDGRICERVVIDARSCDPQGGLAKNLGEVVSAD